MFKAITGTGTGSLAAKTAAEKVKALPNAKFAFVYTSPNFDQNAVLKDVGELMPGVKIVGNTSSVGVITQEGYCGGKDDFVGIMAFADEGLTVGIAAKEKGECAFEAGVLAAKEAMANAGKDCAPTYFHMVCPPGEEEIFLKGITSVIGRVPFFGGSAADNDLTGKWRLFADNKVIADGVAVAFFYTDKPFANVFTGAYKETDKSGVITKIEGARKLIEIDGIPACEKYRQWTGVSQEAVTGGNLLVTTITAPLGVKDRLGDLIAVRHPMAGNEDGSMNIGNNLSVNTAIMLLEGSVDQLVNSTGETVGKVKERLGAKAGAFHLVHCGGRQIGIGDRMDEAVASIKQAAGDTPFIVEFTFGEYGYEQDGNNTCGGLMLSFTGFGE